MLYWIQLRTVARQRHNLRTACLNLLNQVRHPVNTGIVPNDNVAWLQARQQVRVDEAPKMPLFNSAFVHRHGARAIEAEPTQKTQTPTTSQRGMFNQALAALGIAIRQAHALHYPAFIDDFDLRRIDTIKPLEEGFAFGDNVRALGLVGHQRLFFRV
jgi:hypothetical protein